MDSNSNDKKPKRPRIGQPFRTPEEGTDGTRPRPYQQHSANDNQEGGDNHYQPRPYQQRPYQQRPNNYGPRPGGYNNNGYQRPYQPRNYNAPIPAADGEKPEGTQQEGQAGGYQRPYQPRQQRPYNNNGGGYNNNRQQRPYNNNGGGYNNNRQQRPYNNNGGGYNNNRPQNGFNRNRQQNEGFAPRGKSFVPRPKRIEYEMPEINPDEQIRLNKYMSNAGLCSRREADEFIQQGLVKVNGQVVTELGTKITHNDVVEYDEKVVTLQSKCYILLNKPKDCVTTSDDPNGRTTVMDLVKGACTERIYPVGRLDRNTTGVLLLTNDGDLASKLTHPKFVKKKIYHVWCDRDISEEDMQRIADGIELEDGPIHADAISYATETDRNQAGIEIHSGRNRIVRRIFESLGYHVVKLDRVYFAGLTKKNLPRGRWRYLTQEEVNYLKMGSFE